MGFQFCRHGVAVGRQTPPIGGFSISAMSGSEDPRARVARGPPHWVRSSPAPKTALIAGVSSGVSTTSKLVVFRLTQSHSSSQANSPSFLGNVLLERICRFSAGRSQNPAGFGPWGFDSPPAPASPDSYHSHPETPRLSHPYPPPNVNRVRGPEPGQEPHLDQGHEEYNLLGSQSWVIINLLLQFTGGISNGVLEVGLSAPSHGDVASCCL